LIGARKNTLWQSRGEVENIPPDCLPGEGDFQFESVFILNTLELVKLTS